MIERESDISFLTEVWEKKENKKHQLKLEELFEMKGIKYISTPRPGAQRGGGAAIAVRTERFAITKLNIAIPRAVEVVWGLLKPKVVTGKITTIIVCCFYSPPRSRKNAALIDHLTVTLQFLLNTYNDAGVIISGDRNSIDISTLLSIDPSLRQTVILPTRGFKVLDVIVTNLGRFFNEPIIIPPIFPDVLGHGVPSDHSGVFATPNTNSTQVTQRTKVKKKIRPLPESLFPAFETKLDNQNFNFTKEMSPTEMVQKFQDTLTTMVSETFPEKEIIVKSDDKPYFTENLRHLKRRRQREYTKHGRTEKYLLLKDEFEEKLKNEELKYLEKISIEVTEGKRGSTYPALKKLGLRPGEESQSGFVLPNHAQANLTPAQSAELIAEHFSQISQQYAPLNIANLPPNVQAHLRKHDVPPKLSTYDVYCKIVKAKKPNSSVPGDLPRKLVKCFAGNLSIPVTAVYNRITESSVYPCQWKIEQQIPLAKVTPPASEDELRNISKTIFFSKVYESILGGWLMPIIQPYLDPGQCGLRGSSITHYLIKLLDFVHCTLDQKQPQAVLATCVDLSKAFNRVDHTLVIQDLYDMHTPAWLLRILISYLSDRSMYLTYQGANSSRKCLPGGGPQGAYLGGIIFIIKYNGAFLRPPVPRHIGGPVNESKSQKVKFVDDGTVAVSINLKKCLVPDHDDRPRPLNYRERTRHILPDVNNLMQFYLSDTEEFAEQNKLVINKKKTKAILFNKSRKWDFPPEMHFNDNAPVEVVSETKLVGIMIDEKLSWHKNTLYICQKARGKLWLLRRMKRLSLDIFQMFDVYCKEVRSILEFGVPVWHSGLTQKDTADIERVQKVAFQIILEDQYATYKKACVTLNTLTLDLRREQLCLTFAKKNLKSEKTFFTLDDNPINTRRKKKVVKEFKCRTSRYKKSNLPYLAKLLNNNT